MRTQPNEGADAGRPGGAGELATSVEVAAFAIVALGAWVEGYPVIPSHLERIIRIGDVRLPEQVPLAVVRFGQLVGKRLGHVVAAEDQLPRPADRLYGAVHAAQQPVGN